MGWNPDLNDGVRLNIRPFMQARDVDKKGAGVLRTKPNIKWGKDRGNDVESALVLSGLQYGEKRGRVSMTTISVLQINKVPERNMQIRKITDD
jgi:hypothetical protein